MNIVGLRHAVPIMLRMSEIEYLDLLARSLSAQRKAEVSRSEVVEYLLQRHRIKMTKQVAEQRHDAKIAEKRRLAPNAVRGGLLKR